MRLDGKRALVTGASSGIGKAIAWELARRGMKLAIAARRVQSLEKLADEIARAGHTKPVVLAADLSKPGAAADLGQRAAQALGGVDVLVNNAGVGIGGAQAVVGDSQMARDLFETNYWAPLALTRALVPEMRARGEGAVVNVSSIASFAPFPLTGHYSSSKAALSLATEALRTELRSTGVRVLLVLPGPVETAMLEELREVRGVPLDKMPRGNSPELAKLVARSLERDKKVLVYPRSLALGRHLPTLAAKLAGYYGRKVDVDDPRAIQGGSAGDPLTRAARNRYDEAAPN